MSLGFDGSGVVYEGKVQVFGPVAFSPFQTNPRISTKVHSGTCQKPRLLCKNFSVRIIIVCDLLEQQFDCASHALTILAVQLRDLRNGQSVQNQKNK